MENQSMVYIHGGSYSMGSDDLEMGFSVDLEGPSRLVHLDSFYIDSHTVTNREFQAFFLDTGYITEAEVYGSSHVFYKLLSQEQQDAYPPVGGTYWWREVPDASWRKPEGPGSSLEGRMDHPVCHVTWNDAMTYAAWAGKRLPTEAEWEYACRAGHQGLRYPWGNDLTPEGEIMANTWQGDFPEENTLEDGYLGTAPAMHYRPNDYGLYQMIGNVWEWCLNPGRIALDEFQVKSSKDYLKKKVAYSTDYRALRGGSFLCHFSYCQRYRNAGRNATAANSSTSNIGFRCVKDG